jgi:hypothetical protein
VALVEAWQNEKIDHPAHKYMKKILLQKETESCIIVDHIKSPKV